MTSNKTFWVEIRRKTYIPTSKTCTYTDLVLNALLDSVKNL